MSSPLLRLVVLYGGVSAEHDVSRVTAAHVISAADPDRYQVVPIGIGTDGGWVRNDKVIAALSEGTELPHALDIEGTAIEPLTELRTHATDAVTVVLPLLHGPHGEDGTIQGMLELFDVPYVGSGVLSSSVCMDKAMAKVVAAQAGIPQCRWVEFRDGVDDATTIAFRAIEELGLPVFVKPANLGSSVGISKATDAAELDAAINLALRYDDVVVIEEAVDGREIEVAVLGNALPETSVPGEIVPGSDFYDYADKYLSDAAKLLIPAPLSDEALAEVGELAARVFTALRCSGMARVDFFYEEFGRGWLLNEVNTIPGFTPGSMYPKLWAASGVAYGELIDRLVTLALEVHRRRSGFSTEH